MSPQSILGKYLTKQIIFSFLGVLLMVMGIVMLFEVFSSMCALIIMLPYAVSFLLTICSMYVLVKKKSWKGFGVASISAWLAWSIFVPNVASLFLMLAFYLMYEILVIQADQRKISAFVRKGIMVIGISGGVFYCVNLLIQKLMHIGTTTYQGAADAMTGGFRQHFGYNILMCL